MWVALYKLPYIYGYTAELREMGRPRFTVAERLAVFERPRPPGHPFPDMGTCWHCGCTIPCEAFHIDHHPVLFRDIENQVCLGVVDAKDASNLVPSCPPCNLSHAHESRVFCGASQLRVTRLGLWQSCAMGALGTIAVNLCLHFAFCKNQ